MKDDQKTFEEQALLAVATLESFQNDLLEYAEINWLPSQIEMLERAIKEVSTKKKNKDKTYKAEYQDEEFEVFTCENDEDAMKEAKDYEEVHGILFNLFEINEDYDDIRTIF